MTTPAHCEPAAFFAARYSEFAQLPRSTIDAALLEASVEVDAKEWGKFYAMGVAALAAHLLKISAQSSKRGGGGAVGPVTSKKAGDIAITYAAPPLKDQSDAYFASTVYGQRYVELRKLVGIGIRVVQCRP